MEREMERGGIGRKGEGEWEGYFISFIYSKMLILHK